MEACYIHSRRKYNWITNIVKIISDLYVVFVSLFCGSYNMAVREHALARLNNNEIIN